jgi:hypothetical protein
MYICQSMAQFNNREYRHQTTVGLEVAAHFWQKKEKKGGDSHIRKRKDEGLSFPRNWKTIFSFEVTMGRICWAPSLAKAHRGCGPNKGRNGTRHKWKLAHILANWFQEFVDNNLEQRPPPPPHVHASKQKMQMGLSLDKQYLFH